MPRCNFLFTKQPCARSVEQLSWPPRTEREREERREKERIKRPPLGECVRGKEDRWEHLADYVAQARAMALCTRDGKLAAARPAVSAQAVSAASASETSSGAHVALLPGKNTRQNRGGAWAGGHWVMKSVMVTIALKASTCSFPSDSRASPSRIPSSSISVYSPPALSPPRRFVSKVGSSQSGRAQGEDKRGHASQLLRLRRVRR